MTGRITAAALALPLALAALGFVASAAEPFQPSRPPQPTARVETSLPPWAETSGALGRAAMPAGRLSKPELDALVEAGEALFKAKFTRLEGAGRPGATQAIVPTQARRADRDAVARGRSLFQRTSGSDANACVACHNDPAVGGAGDFVTTTFVSEGFSNAAFDSTDPQFSNERGSNHLFGAGLVELLAREMSADLARQRREALREAKRSGAPVVARLETKGVSFGRLVAAPDGTVDLASVEGVDPDLVVRPFGQKGVMTSLRQFTVNAGNFHMGLQAAERFGRRWTGGDDHDGDGHRDEWREADVSALVAWQAALPPPVERAPADPAWRAAAARGSTLMDEWRCTACHRRALPLDSLVFQDPGPLDAPGTLSAAHVARPGEYDLALLDWAARLPRDAEGRVLVPLWGDLKRHVMTDRTESRLGNELLSQRFVERNVWATTELWGVGSTAPFGHRNDMTTLDEVIRAHGGAGAAAKELYVGGTEDERSALIAFLKTLVIE